MARLAIIENGTVVNVIMGAPGFAGGIECEAAVGIGWSYAGGAFIAPPLPDPSPVDLVAYTANKRWQREVGGITVGGVPVATDDRSKMMLMGARIAAVADGNFTTQWKTQAGFVTLDAATIIVMSNAVLAHVDQCFAIEAQVLVDIAGDTITTTEQVDAAFA